MTLEDLGNLGELAGAVGVIASLIYLAVQIRQNTRSMRAASSWAFVREMSDWTDLILESRELTHTFLLGLRSPEELGPTQEAAFYTLARRYFRNFENLYQQHRDSLVSPRLFEAWVVEFRRIARQPGMRRWWEGTRHQFTADFQGFVQDVLDASPPSDART